MSTIWIDQYSRLKAYSAVVKGPKSIVKIEIECAEPGSLGYLLEGLRDIERDQNAQIKREKESVRRKPKALAAPLLQIADMRGPVE